MFNKYDTIFGNAVSVPYLSVLTFLGIDTKVRVLEPDAV